MVGLGAVGVATGVGVTLGVIVGVAVRVVGVGASGWYSLCLG